MYDNYKIWVKKITFSTIVVFNKYTGAGMEKNKNNNIISLYVKISWNTKDWIYLKKAPLVSTTISRLLGISCNAHKTEYMCYNQTGDISTLDGIPLKLVNKFNYLGSSVASTEKDIDTRLTKAWTAINRLSIIWKSDLTDKMKRSFFQAAVASILLYGCTTSTLTKRLEKKLEVLAATPYKTPTVRPPASYHENYSS